MWKILDSHFNAVYNTCECWDPNAGYTRDNACECFGATFKNSAYICEACGTGEWSGLFLLSLISVPLSELRTNWGLLAIGTNPHATGCVCSDPLGTLDANNNCYSPCPLNTWGNFGVCASCPICETFPALTIEEILTIYVRVSSVQSPRRKLGRGIHLDGKVYSHFCHTFSKPCRVTHHLPVAVPVPKGEL